MISKIDGGITSPKGFKASGVESSIKKGSSKDMVIIASDDIAVAAGVFTENAIKSPSVNLTMQNVKNGYAHAVVVNSGNANIFVGEQGNTDALEMATLTASLLDSDDYNILVGSVGKPGLLLNMPSVRAGIRKAVNELAGNAGEHAAEGMMSNDNYPKEYAVEEEIQGEKIRIGGVATGALAEFPEQNSLLCVLTTDINISKSLLQKAIQDVTAKTFKKVYRSEGPGPSDMVLILANGEANNPGIVKEDFEYKTFVKALENVCGNIAKMIAKDIKGPSKLIEITIEGASDEVGAKKVINAVAKNITSKKVITDKYVDYTNILSAIGNSGTDFNPSMIDIIVGDIVICRNSLINKFEMSDLTAVLGKSEVSLKINMKKGTTIANLWASAKY